MTNVEQRLKQAWDTIRGFETGSVKLGIEHPLDWYVAYETPTNKALVIISEFPIEQIEPSKCINTACRQREDGSYYISFQLIEKSQEDVFINMCSNIIDYSSTALSSRDAMKKVAMRYKQWRKLMEHRNLAILSDEKRRGLIGELLYLKKTIENGKPASEALAGWVGPDGADQDFVYDGEWREIKTTGLSSDQISIHSLEQLGTKADKGVLVIYRIDSCAPEQNGAFNLRELINNITKLFDGDFDLVEKLTNKLNSVGYIDMEIYDRFPYKYFKDEQYYVDNEFPRITREEIRSEIIKCDYVLSISSIDKWRE